MDNTNNNLLLKAASSGELNDLEKALAGGADVNFKNGDGRTALMKAAKRGYREIVDVLSDKGAVVDDIKNQILAETGVNLDEELANMIMYQQAYKASARVFSCCVQVCDTLVALGS